MITIDKKSDRRQHIRRSLNMPISFLPGNAKDNIADYSFGQTLDVSSWGVCVSTRSDSIPDVNTMVTMFVNPENQSSKYSSDVSVTIYGKVAWSNIEKQNFGVKFLQNR